MKPGVREYGRAGVRAYRRTGGERARAGAAAAVLLLGMVAAVPATAQIAVQGGAIAALAEHRVDAGRGVEQSSGTLLGGEGKLLVGSRFELFLHAASGTLAADSAGAEDRDVAQAEARISVLTVPWLALHAGFSVRSYGTALVRQRWTAARFGGEVRLEFVGVGVTGMLRGEILPSVTVSGLAKPRHAYAAAAGLEWRMGVVALALRYELERYDFPLQAGVERHEQFGALTANLGLGLGRR